MKKVRKKIQKSQQSKNSQGFLKTIFQETLEDRTKVFIFTHEVDTVDHRRRDSGPGDCPGPTPACPLADWGGSDRTPPSQVWGYTLGIATLRKNKTQD